MNPTCNENCDYDLGALLFSICAPQTAASQLRRLFIGKPNAAAFNDWKDQEEWLARVNQTLTSGDDYIRALTITGDKPQPASVQKTIENGIKVTQGKDHTVNFTTYQVNDANYEFMRKTECSIQVRLFGIETMGGILFGSNTGVLVNIVMDSVLAGGDDDLETLTGALTWRSKFSLERTQSPIFDIDFNGTGGGASNLDTAQQFANAANKVDAGVTTTVPATDPDLKFEFNAITPQIGAPSNMILKIAGSSVASIDYPSDYAGAPWRFTSASGTLYSGTFSPGVKNLV